jgi:hypothetical protein
MNGKKLALAGIALATIAACKSPTSPEVDYSKYAGVYSLKTISNTPLPWIRINSDGSIDKILASSYELSRDGMYTYTVVSSLTDKTGKVTVNTGSLFGKYSVDSNTISMYNKGWSGGTYRLQFIGVLAGNNLVFKEFNYSK